MQRGHGLGERTHRHALPTSLRIKLPPHRGCHHRIWNRVCSMNHLRIESLTVSLSGSIPVGFTAMLGPRFGMRTMVITRYSFGYWGAAVISLLNVLTQVRVYLSEHNFRYVCDLVPSQPYSVILWMVIIPPALISIHVRCRTKLCFCVVGSILAGQVLHNINPKMPLVVSVVLIGYVPRFVGTLFLVLPIRWNVAFTSRSILSCTFFHMLSCSCCLMSQ